MSISDTNADVAALIDAFGQTLPWPLDDFQHEAIAKFETHAGVLVSAPTSSGKTVVAEYTIWRAVAASDVLVGGEARAHHVIYTTPLKALSNQKYHELCVRYGEENVGLVTGEHTINDSAKVIVMTTEILRNILYEEPARVDVVGTVILDEVHYIDDFPRGTVWEEIIIEAPSHIRLVGLSATISNVDEIAAWMTSLRGDVATVVRTERPVPLEMWLSMDNRIHPLFDHDGHVMQRTLEKAQRQEASQGRFRYAQRAPDNDLFAVIEGLRQRSMLPAIYFIFSRKGCREALERCAMRGVNLTTDEEKGHIRAELERRAEAVTDDDERTVFLESLDPTVLACGVSMHHAGMLPYAKECVETLFHRGLIKVVFATETLSLGLNMPAKACVISSFTKFDGQNFAPLTSGELSQLMGRAGRRGIDTIGHGIILKESDVDIRDIYEAALGSEMAVISKFAPTYGMTLSLLKTRTVERAESLLDRSFGQFQTVQQFDNWDVREANAQTRLDDLKHMMFRHPHEKCTERTLSQYLHARNDIDTKQAALRQAKRERFRSSRRGKYGGRAADPGQKIERLQRDLKVAHRVLHQSPCRYCPNLAAHEANRTEIAHLEATLRGGTKELEAARSRYRREFAALRAVLTEAGFLEDNRPTELGLLAASLYGESALLVAESVAAGVLDHLTPPELAASLVMLVAEDRGRDRPPLSRRHFPTPAVERTGRALRSVMQRLAALEEEHGLRTIRPLSFDYIQSTYEWASGIPLTEIDAPGAADLGDVVKAVKNVYSLLRQMEMALRKHRLGALVSKTREALERDLIRRI